jgi:hypothetical protein
MRKRAARSSDYRNPGSSGTGTARLVQELAHRAVVSIAMVDFIEETQGP